MERMKCFYILLLFVTGTSALDILSFNIKQFGRTKYSNQPVIDAIINIVEQYDLILLMELVDVSQTVLPGFVQQLNEHVSNRSIEYRYTVSERLGRTRYKEQYVYLYRSDSVEIVSTFQYNNTQDVFERPPYSVLVKSVKHGIGVIPQFFIVGSHNKPTDTLNELNNLDEVFHEARTVFDTDIGMIMGDVNADCSYLSNANYAQLDLILDANFTWWIDKEADTTTSNSDCAYDRIITGIKLNPFVVDDSVEIVRYDIQFNLTSEETSAISDHYPVKISLRGYICIANCETVSSIISLSNVPLSSITPMNSHTQSRSIATSISSSYFQSSSAVGMVSLSSSPNDGSVSQSIYSTAPLRFTTSSSSSYIQPSSAVEMMSLSSSPNDGSVSQSNIVSLFVFTIIVITLIS